MRVFMKDARDSKGLSRRTLADKLGVSHRTIEQMEYGYRNPSLSVLFALARILGPAVLDGFKAESDNAAAALSLTG